MKATLILLLLALVAVNGTAITYTIYGSPDCSTNATTLQIDSGACTGSEGSSFQISIKDSQTATVCVWDGSETCPSTNSTCIIVTNSQCEPLSDNTSWEFSWKGAASSAAAAFTVVYVALVMVLVI